MKEILKNSYNKTASVYDEKFKDIQFAKYSAILPLYMPVIQNASSILDLGCGTGLLSEYLESFGIKSEIITGIDFSIEMLALAEKRKIKCINKDINELSLPENSFSLVFSFTVFRIIDGYNEDEILAVVKKALINNGYFIVTLLSPKADESWSGILKKHDFKIINMIECGQDTGFVCINKK